MDKGYYVLLLVALLLIVAMSLTVLWGRDSKHGYGFLPDAQQILASAQRVPGA